MTFGVFNVEVHPLHGAFVPDVWSRLTLAPQDIDDVRPVMDVNVQPRMEPVPYDPQYAQRIANAHVRSIDGAQKPGALDLEWFQVYLTPGVGYAHNAEALVVAILQSVTQHVGGPMPRPAHGPGGYRTPRYLQVLPLSGAFQLL